jgi:hypothetical protein
MGLDMLRLDQVRFPLLDYLAQPINHTGIKAIALGDDIDIDLGFPGRRNEPVRRRPINFGPLQAARLTDKRYD